MNQPATVERAREGLSLADALRSHVGCGVIVIEGGNKIAALTDQAKYLLGFVPDQAALPLFKTLPAPVQALVRKTLASGKAPATREMKFKAGSRGSVTLHVSVAPLGRGRKNSGVVVMLNDLTPARQVEERLTQLDRLATMGTLAATMAHEIKNALVPCKTFIELLLEKHQDSELVGVVRRELSRIDAIVSRMLQFAGPVRPAFGAVRLHEVLDHSLRLVQPQLAGKAIALNCSFQAAPDGLSGDEYQLQQAFVNLFLNALEAMGPNGSLSVATELCSMAIKPARRGGSVDRTHLRVAITDTGAGISPEDMARLFEPFFTTKPKGTGLGLAITRRIIQDHRGAISVESSPGQGTAFQILLPATG